MWSVDALADAVTAAVQAVATISQFAADLEIFASPAFGYLTLDASLCRASVLMPQKRNPYALAVLRGGAGTYRPPGRPARYRPDPVRAHRQLALRLRRGDRRAGPGRRLVRLGAAVAAGLRPDRAVLGEQVVSQFTAAADLAEELTAALRPGLPDRLPRGRPGGRRRGGPRRHGSDRGAVRAAAEKITGEPIPVTADPLAAATDPVWAVTPGTPGRRQSPAGTGARTGRARGWRRQSAERRPPGAHRQAESALLEAARTLTSTGD